jgi:hypothetical protein
MVGYEPTSECAFFCHIPVVKIVVRAGIEPTLVSDNEK